MAVEHGVSVSERTEEIPVTFSSFAISLAQSALAQMGETPAGAPAVEQNLGLARHAIDILGMLESKTQGNLDEEEQKLLASLLDELRMKFVTAAKAARG